ncbi:hypothetical protein [Streptomyces xiamenensis]
MAPSPSEDLDARTERPDQSATPYATVACVLAAGVVHVWVLTS